MTRLRKMMLEELQRRNYSEITTRKYLQVGDRLRPAFRQVPRQARAKRTSKLSGNQLPTVRISEEVSRLINATGTLFRRTLLITLYGTGMRRAELARLNVSDI